MWRLCDEVNEISVLAPNSNALFCEQLEVFESIVPVVPAIADVEVVGMLALIP